MVVEIEYDIIVPETVMAVADNTAVVLVGAYTAIVADVGVIFAPLRTS